MSALDELLERLTKAPAEIKAQVIADVLERTKAMPWIPNMGPQTQAYFHPAKILLYGGAGGGGKTDLIVGLAYTAHERSLMLRRKYADLGGLLDRAKQIHGSKQGFNGSPPPRLTFQREDKECIIDFVGNQHLGDEQSQQGKPYDFKAVDEATQFLETQIRFHLGWLRSATPGQRTRMIMASNPPIDSNGDWVIGFFRPWLDLTHPNPAKPGELRWYVRTPDDTDLEVDRPGFHDLPGAPRPVEAVSRSFIPALLKDNPYLVNTDYGAQLDALPEPIRSAVRDGNFMATRKDVDNQMIPTAWIQAAQARWTERHPEGFAMTALAADIAQGGADATTIAARYGGWFAPLVSQPGVKTPGGLEVMQMIVGVRRDACPVILDGGGGFAGATKEKLVENGIDPVIYKGSEAVRGKRDKSGILGFANKRSYAYWRLREELDPEQDGGSGVALPPDPAILSELAAPTFEVVTIGGLSCIKAETKDDVKAKLGKSPDNGDAIVMCFCEGERIALRMKGKLRRDLPTKSQRGYSHLKG